MTDYGKSDVSKLKPCPFCGGPANYERGFVCSCGLDVCRCIQEGAA